MGVLLPALSPLSSFFYKVDVILCLFSIPQFSPSTCTSHTVAMSSPSSSYVQVDLDNLECPINCSPSPRAQVRGLIGLLLVDD